MKSFKLDASNETQFFRCFLQSPWSMKLFVVIMFVRLILSVGNIISGTYSPKAIWLIIGSIVLLNGILVHGSKWCRILTCGLIMADLIGVFLLMIVGHENFDVFVMIISLVPIILQIVLLFLPPTSRHMQLRRDIMIKTNNKSGDMI